MRVRLRNNRHDRYMPARQQGGTRSACRRPSQLLQCRRRCLCRIFLLQEQPEVFRAPPMPGVKLREATNDLMKPWLHRIVSSKGGGSSSPDIKGGTQGRQVLADQHELCASRIGGRSIFADARVICSHHPIGKACKFSGCFRAVPRGVRVFKYGQKVVMPEHSSLQICME